MPRVLISDALSPAAVQIFRDRGVEVDFQPDLGKDKEALAAIIHQYGHKRYQVDRSELMFHPASGGVEGEGRRLHQIGAAIGSS